MEKTFAYTLDYLSLVPEGNYEGYYWASNAQKPIKIKTGDSLEQLKSIRGNPFVMEALLYDRHAELSIHVLHTGRQQITCYDWKQFDNSEMVSGLTDQVTFVTQKIDGIEGLQFSRIWKKERDPLCADREVMKMFAIVFSGFKPTKP